MVKVLLPTVSQKSDCSFDIVNDEIAEGLRVGVVTRKYYIIFNLQRKKAKKLLYKTN